MGCALNNAGIHGQKPGATDKRPVVCNHETMQHKDCHHSLEEGVA